MGKKLFYVATGILAVLWLLPVAIMFSTSFAKPQVYFQPNAIPLFTSFTLEHWLYVLGNTNYLKPLFISLAAATCSTFLTLVLTLPAAFAISHRSRKTVYGFLLLTFSFRMLPEVSVALPLSVSFSQIGLFDTPVAIILAHTVRAFPLAAWILINTMQNIPKEINHAARIDGSNYWQRMTKIVIPIAKPGIAVAAIFSFLSSWEEFTYASYLLVTNKTLPLEVFYHVNRSGWFIASTYSVLITVPVIIAIYTFQRHLTVDTLRGAVKG